MRACFSVGVGGLLIAGTLHPSTAAAQHPEPPTRMLRAANARSLHHFSLIRGLRELPDGRVMISDWMEQRLVMLDRALTTIRDIGRVGSGPHEFRLPAGLVPLPGDSTLLVDVGNTRLSVIGQDGELHRSLEHPAGFGMLPTPRAADARGRLYFTVPPWVPQADPPSGDSVALVRWDPGSGAVERVAVVLGARRPARADRPRHTPGIPLVPFAPQDGWTVTEAGVVVVVRAGDYSVEWLPAEGTGRRGPAHVYPQLAVRRTDKAAFVRRFVQSSPMSGRGPDGAMGHSPPELASREAIEQTIATNEFADRLPYFVSRGVWWTPEGALWVERSSHAGDAVTFDVFDADGVLREHVRLPIGREVVGFGRGVVYTVVANDLDLLTLERFPR